jgi:hypothetical protein
MFKALKIVALQLKNECNRSFVASEMFYLNAFINLNDISALMKYRY